MVEQKDYVSYSVLINGIEVNAVYSRDSIDGIFRPLLRRLTRMHPAPSPETDEDAEGEE